MGSVRSGEWEEYADGADDKEFATVSPSPALGHSILLIVMFHQPSEEIDGRRDLDAGDWWDERGEYAGSPWV